LIDERDPLIALDFDAAVLRHALHDQPSPQQPVSPSGRPRIIPDWDPYKVLQP
jgi:hypothetical protein